MSLWHLFGQYSSWGHFSILAIPPLLLNQFWPNFKGRFLGQSLTDANCQGDIYVQAKFVLVTFVHIRNVATQILPIFLTHFCEAKFSWPKILFHWIFLESNIFGPKLFWDPNILEPTLFWIKICLGPKIFLNSRFFWTQFFFWI